jgi:P2X purinoceptor 4
VSPPQYGDNGGFFIMTNVVITPNQTRDKCPEDPKVETSICVHDDDCTRNKTDENGNGVRTGKCVPSTINPEIKTCETFAWCPFEQDDVLPFNGSRPLLTEAFDFTVLIKNTISFPKFGEEYQKRNILEDADKNFLKHCRYNATSKTDRFCPVFRIGDIVEMAGGSSRVAIRGGVFVIRIKWNCNLDLNFKNCRPVYTFDRMDNKDSLISPGWNFRYAEYEGYNQRTLYKKHGLKFVIEVSGFGRQFRIVPLMLNIGSGLGLLGLAQLFAGLLVSYCLKDAKAGEIKRMKYLRVEVGDDDVINVNSKIRETLNQTKHDSALPNPDS